MRVCEIVSDPGSVLTSRISSVSPRDGGCTAVRRGAGARLRLVSGLGLRELRAVLSAGTPAHGPVVGCTDRGDTGTGVRRLADAAPWHRKRAEVLAAPSSWGRGFVALVVQIRWRGLIRATLRVGMPQPCPRPIHQRRILGPARPRDAGPGPGERERQFGLPPRCRVKRALVLVTTGLRCGGGEPSRPRTGVWSSPTMVTSNLSHQARDETSSPRRKCTVNSFVMAAPTSTRADKVIIDGP
jgi:hypothetical protein